MVKKLFLIRHAESLHKDNRKPLTTAGLSQCHSISEIIGEHIGSSSIEIWHSTHHNATETAELIGSILGIEKLIPDERLISDISHFTDFAWLEEAIAECNSDVLIIISHLEYVWYYPEFIGLNAVSADYCEGSLIEGSKQTILGL